MARFLISDTQYGTKRVWVEKDSDGLIGGVSRDLDILSIWRGRDKSGENYVSWELDADPESGIVDAARMRLNSYGFTEAEFQPE